MHVDLCILDALAWLADQVAVLHCLLPRKCMREFRAVMAAQVDLRHEARSLQRLTHNFARSPSIRLPQPLYCTSSVLVETYEQGVPIGAFIPGGSSGTPSERRLRSTLAHLGLRAMCQMVFVDNFVHGDMHPGNILVQQAAGPAATRLERVCQRAVGL